MSAELPTAGKLTGRRLLIGVTGGIAAYKAAELVRLLSKQGAEVQVVMTEAAQAFITPLTLQALSGRPVRTELLDDNEESAMGHIALARWAELILVAPATADFLARLASGQANDLLSTVCLAAETPLFLAPAMNRVMWQQTATQENLATLNRRGMVCWGPASGEQACGETGEGRMLEPVELADNLLNHFSSGPLQGVNLLLTAGPTQEPIDPVRFIGNRSSGKMGFALARAFVLSGANVTLVTGPVNLPTPDGVDRVDVVTAADMHEAVQQHLAETDIFVACAAVADYRVAQPAQEKLKKTSEPMTLQLLPNEDILASVAAGSPAPFTVGFAAETGNLLRNANDKRIRKGIDMIAANLVGTDQGGFEDDNNALTLIWEGGQRELPMSSKDVLAMQMAALVAERFVGSR